MTKYGVSKFVDVVVGYVVTAVEQRFNLRCGDKSLTCTRAGTKTNVFLCCVRCTFAVGVRCGAKRHCISHNFFSYGDLVCSLSHFEQFVTVTCNVCNFRHRLLRQVYDVHQFVKARVLNDELEHETVHLCFGKRIRTVLFDRVLRSKYEEGFVHLSRYTHNRYGVFLHGFEQCGLRFRGSTVDFVGKDDVAEDRTGLELEGRVTIFVFYDDVRTRNVRRHQVWRELNTGEGKVEYAAKRTNQTGLTYARYTFKQYVTTSDHCDNRTFNDFFLTDNVTFNLGKNIFALFAEFFNVLFGNHNIFPLLKIFFFFVFCVGL